MPEICRFYGEYVAKITIDSLEIIEGSLPDRALRLVREWARLHDRELRDAFERASNFETPTMIEPLP